jgi:hypothetical protein
VVAEVLRVAATLVVGEAEQYVWGCMYIVNDFEKNRNLYYQITF